jgi:tetratricopeptide (TPR) repeat protein
VPGPRRALREKERPRAESCFRFLHAAPANRSALRLDRWRGNDRRTMSASSVRLWREPVVLPTYAPAAPQRNPMFLDRRVYQGSSGKVYPLPVIDRIAEVKKPRAWDAVHLENEFLRVMILPEIGGRIHVAQDKTNGYDFIYRQEVIKPALVGLAGPWISGGIEFNWPQHHRPSTFLRCDVHLEEHADGSKTAWLSEHDPMLRMKGMHGVCLHPGRAVIELKVRAYNRTPFVQTFLWWANAAARVHEAYQSFFPPDVTCVADHAKRSMSAYPLCTGRYYGVDYAARAKRGVRPDEQPRKFLPAGDVAPNDLSWYANIPVPTSYMCVGTREDFFGGYDFKARAGVIHVADRHIAPGKKQWTWGNHEFGYAWDRNLTDPDIRGECAPYIELMAGVFTDNQPDFSFLQPGETKTWSQFWYPIREIGPAQHANLEAAVSLTCSGKTARVGVAVTRRRAAKLRLSARSRVVFESRVELAPDRPLVTTLALPPRVKATDLRLSLLDDAGGEIIRYQPRPRARAKVPAPATESPAPEKIASADELWLTGVHLEQYRHATRAPEDYWREALRRDPGDARCQHALGAWHLRRGEFAAAERHLRAAIARLTSRNPNPRDGEPYYTLGLVLRHLGRDDEAYDAIAKATWNHAWQSAGFHALAEIDCRRADWPRALEHLEAALRVNTDHLRARDLKAVVLRRLGRHDEADALLRATLSLDPLDWWARHLLGEPLACDTQTRLDLVHDCVRAGLHADALALLEAATPEPDSGTAPLVAYTAAWICHLMNDKPAARRWRKRAQAASPDFCFPARLEEFVLLSWAVATDARDARAAYYLGNLLYDRGRRAEAVAAWENAVRRDPDYSVAWRNLGIGYFNERRQPEKARRAYERAFRADPRDARLFYERDQLWQRLRVAPARRLREFEKHRDLVAQRDDLVVEYGALLLLADRAAEALALVAQRKFQPWEGGEGLARGVFVRAHLALGRQALAAGDTASAGSHFEQALTSPENLGEARHLLANPADVYFWLGCAREAQGARTAAQAAWRRAAASVADFQGMRVTEFSEQTFYAACALEKLGRRAAARALCRRMLSYAWRLARQPATIDYFATSLPTMILFADDLQARQSTHARLLEALALQGLGQVAAARRALRDVLRREPGHAVAREPLGFAVER